MQGEASFDFIVTGAGSAGCAVAGRLSEDGRHSVLLLEAGPRDSYPWIHVPLGYHKTFNNPKVNWMFDSEPEPELNGRVMYQPRGKVLGGTSSINGMVYMRGNAADYDEWRQRGCEGWDYASVLPYFKRAEDQERGASEYHGVGGPLKVSDLRLRRPIPRLNSTSNPCNSISVSDLFGWRMQKSAAICSSVSRSCGCEWLNSWASSCRRFGSRTICTSNRFSTRSVCERPVSLVVISILML